jgi:hypothetical protein
VKRETCEKGATWTDWIPTSSHPSCQIRLSRSIILRGVLPLYHACGPSKFSRAKIVFPQPARAVRPLAPPIELKADLSLVMPRGVP